MKAKIIKTGEIVDVYHEPEHGQVSNIYKESVLVNGRMWQENELEFIESKEVDLEKEIKRFTMSKELYEADSAIKAVAEHFFELGLSQKADWHPSKKQMESLKDMLNYNIGVFDYQKFMEVNSLYDDLKILDYETDR